MKRFLIVIFLFSFWIITAKGETFYTDYKLEVSNSMVYDDTLLNNELYKIIIKKGYNNYKQVRVNEGYYELNKQPKSLKYQDLNDYIYKDVYSKKMIYDNIQYQTNLIYKFEEVRSIGIRCFVSKAIFKPENVTITYNDEVIDYTIHKSNYDYESIPNSSTRIELDLGKKYPLKDLKITIKFQDKSLSYLAFMLDVYENIYYLTAPYGYYTVRLYRNSPEEVINISFATQDEFLSLAKKMNWIREKNYASLKEINYFYNQYTLYKYYNIKNSYLNTYTEHPIEGYEIDYEDYKDLYDYYVRDYIEVKDVINNKDELNNIILSSSVPLEDIHLDYYNITNDKVLVKFTYQGNIFYKNIIINNLPIEDIDSDKVNNEVKDEFSTLDEIKVKTNDNTIFNKARNRNQLNEESNSNKLINNPKNSILDKN